MITVVTSTLKEIPKGSVEGDAVDTLLVACRPWQLEYVIDGLKRLTGDKLVAEPRVMDSDDGDWKWVHLTYRIKVFTMTFNNAISMSRWSYDEVARGKHYVLRPYDTQLISGNDVKFALYDKA